MPHRLHGDELRIRQICNNFLSNAFKYTKEGTVELSVSSAINGDDVWLILSVKDTGIGIKKEDVVKLFSAYNQVDTKSNRLIEGTGLGLSIAKRMAQMMDGTIDVESDYGTGSTFTATVKQKFVTDEPIGREVAEELENFQFHTKRSSLHRNMVINKMPYARVLIVDDVQTNLDVARGMLKPYQMKIDCVNSGRQAVNLIKAHEVHFDAIFMDHMMPEMDGIEAVAIIRNQIGTDYAKNIPIIALTANAIIGNDKMFLRSGFQAYLSKPMDMSAVDKVLNIYVRNKDKERQMGFENTEAYSQNPEKASEKAPETDSKEDDNMAPNTINYQPIQGITVIPAPDKSVSCFIPGVDVEAGIKRFGGERENFFDSLRSFATNTETLLKDIQEPKPEDLKSYMITVHGIKSSSYGVCANKCGKLAEELENAATEGNFSFIESHNQSFIQEARTLIEDIRSRLTVKDDSQNDKKNVVDKPDEKLISSLIQACESYDMDGIDLIIAELDKFSYESDPNLVEWLKEKAETMEFDRISEKFQSG
jgi:CheY-like chemotaxis protein/anti-sigma regulatory factor (Ser/Thr protein kinase)